MRGAFHASLFAGCASCIGGVITQSTGDHGRGCRGRYAAPSADEQAIRDAGEAYRAAFAKGDVEAVAAFWTKNADLVDQSGHAFKVQAVLESGPANIERRAATSRSRNAKAKPCRSALSRPTWCSKTEHSNAR